MARAKSYRQPTLRQIEAFKAVIETGTVSRAAEVLNMSQPAASKLLTNLEADIGLELFERRRGLLVPTARGVRFYEEVDRIFSGLNQINQAVDTLRREERGQLVIGVLPGLSGHFVCDVIQSFTRLHPDVHIALHGRSSQYLMEWMRSGHLDLALVAGRFDGGHIETELILRQPIVCFLPFDHPLAAKDVLRLEDIAEAPFISFMSSSYTRLQLDRIFEAQGLRPNIVMEASNAQNVCELVACGLGIALAHPIYIAELSGKVAIRPFLPQEMADFLLCRPRQGRSRRLVDDFITCLHEKAESMVRIGVSSP